MFPWDFDIKDLAISVSALTLTTAAWKQQWNSTAYRAKKTSSTFMGAPIRPRH